MVKLQGPWPVLRSGAVLVDLPGVRDTNVTRVSSARMCAQPGALQIASHSAPDR